MAQRLEEVRNGVVKIIGDNSFSGTGFFISKQLCVTCHHVIWNKNQLMIEFNEQKFAAKWDESRSSLENDISMLIVEDEIGTSPVKCAQEVTPNLRVSVYGYTGFTQDDLRSGSEIPGELLNIKFPYQKPEKFREINNPWNKKPKVNVDVFQITANYAGNGLSGSPVWESNRGMVVGMFVAAQGEDPSRDLSSRGFIIQ